jgi:hypothetical protein
MAPVSPAMDPALRSHAANQQHTLEAQQRLMHDQQHMQTQNNQHLQQAQQQLAQQQQLQAQQQQYGTWNADPAAGSSGIWFDPNKSVSSSNASASEMPGAAVLPAGSRSSGDLFGAPVMVPAGEPLALPAGAVASEGGVLARVAVDTVNAAPVDFPASGNLGPEDFQWRRINFEPTSAANVPDDSLPVPEPMAASSGNYFRSQPTDTVVDSASVLPTGNYNGGEVAQTIDESGTTNKTSVDGGLVDSRAEYSMARSSIDNSTAQATAVQSMESSSQNADLPNNAIFNEIGQRMREASNRWEGNEAPTAIAAIIYRQRQSNIVEEKVRTPVFANPGVDAEKRQLTAGTKPQNEKLNQLRANCFVPPASAAGVSPLKKGHSERTGEAGQTEQTGTVVVESDARGTAKKSLAEQIMYQNIRNRQRQVGQISEEEYELMRQLGLNGSAKTTASRPTNTQAR